MKRFSRPAGGAIAALALTLIAAAPAAATQPLRTVTEDGPITKALPAGTFCDFNVTSFRPHGSQLTVTDYSDGRESVTASVVGRTYTKDATGKSLVASTDVHETDWFDVPQQVHGVATGKFLYQLVPGDIGPDGKVVDHLEELYIQGQASYAYDSNTFATLKLAIVGTASDICAELSK